MKPFESAEPGRGWAVAFGAIVAGAALSGVIGVASMLSVGREEDRVVARYLDNTVTTERLRSAAGRESSSARAFLLTRDAASLDRSRRGRAAFAAQLTELRATPRSLEEARVLDEIDASYELYDASLDHALALARGGASEEVVRADVEAAVVPAKRDLDERLTRLAAIADREAGRARDASVEARSRAVGLLAAGGIFAVALAATLGVLLWRAARRLARDRHRLGESLARVEQSNRDLDAFAGRVAHDLRNALSPAVMGVAVLRSSPPSRERIERVCDRLDRANQRAMAVIDALLAFSRVKEPRGDDQSSLVGDVLDDVLEQLGPLATQLDVAIERSVPNVEVGCSAGLLQVVLANVIGNAVKFLHDRPDRRVTITGVSSEMGCDIRVDDTGVGIPESLRERVFEPFFRAAGTTTKGTGIGLATVRRILDAHGGRIHVASSPAGGASFRLWLPRPRPDDAALSVSPLPHPLQ